MPPVIGLPLPNAATAIIERVKLEGYVLNSAHVDGSHKARVFRSALGIEAFDWRYLHQQIVAGLRRAPVKAITSTPYGLRCSVVLQIEGRNGERHDVLTGWLVEGDLPPRLITAYVDL